MHRVRKGMWVLYGKRVGILVNFSIDKVQGEVHLVDEAGYTYSILGEVHLDELTQASLTDIPQSRRPDKNTARPLGYLQDKGTTRPLSEFILDMLPWRKK